MLSLDELFFLFTLRYNPLQEEYKPKTELVKYPSTINIALSSGIDSHYLLNTFRLTREIGDVPLKAICIDFIDCRNGVPESEKAKALADSFEVPFECVIIDDPLADLDKLIPIVGEPRWNLYQYYLYKACKEDTGVLLTGDGADEYYLGYTFRYKKYLDNIDKCITWKDRANQYLYCHINDWVTDQTRLFKEGFSWYPILEYLEQFFYTYPYGNNLTDHLAPVIAADINGKLRYDYFPCNNKIADNLGIQLICPFLNGRDAKDAGRIPIHTRYDYRSNLGKLPLRNLVNRLDKEKIGFGFDLLSYWTRKGFDRINSKINKDSRVFDYISRDWYIKHLSDITVPIINKYLQIYSLELYLEIIEKEENIRIPNSGLL